MGIEVREELWLYNASEADRAAGRVGIDVVERTASADQKKLSDLAQRISTGASLQYARENIQHAAFTCYEPSSTSDSNHDIPTCCSLILHSLHGGSISAMRPWQSCVGGPRSSLLVRRLCSRRQNVLTFPSSVQYDYSPVSRSPSQSIKDLVTCHCSVACLKSLPQK